MDIKKIVANNLNRFFKNHIYVSNHGPANGLNDNAPDAKEGHLCCT